MSPLLISIIIAILTFLLQDPENSKERRKALLVSALAGLGTYYVATETDWGRSVFGNDDDSIGNTGNPRPVLDEDGNPIPNPGGGSSGTGSSGAGSWIRENIIPILTGAALGVAGGKGSPWFFILLLGAFLLLRN